MFYYSGGDVIYSSQSKCGVRMSLDSSAAVVDSPRPMIEVYVCVHVLSLHVCTIRRRHFAQDLSISMYVFDANYAQM